MTRAGVGIAQACVPDADRIRALDALRGVALLGILIANVRQMFLPWDVANLPVALGSSGTLAWLDWQFFHAFVDLKFLAIFSLLFGIGFALQAERLSASGRDFRRIYLRRVLILVLFGVAHGLLLYPAEVLMPYALTALLLFAVRGYAAGTLLRMGLALLGLMVIWGYQVGALSHVDVLFTLVAAAAFAALIFVTRATRWSLTLALWAVLVLGLGLALTLLHPPEAGEAGPAAQFQAAQAQLAAMARDDASGWPVEYRVRRAGGLRELLALHANQYLQLMLYVAVLLLWRTLGIFMIGAGVFRAGLLSARSSTPWRRVAAIGLGVGIPFSLLATWLHTREIQGLADWRYPQFLHEFSSLLMASGIAAAVFLRFRSVSADARHPLWGRVESAGRMALTNYVGQSFVIAALAEKWGFGLYGRLDGPTLTAIALAVFVALACASHVWLRHFQMGPLEWLWRCGTYGSWLPNRRRQVPLAI